MCMCGFNINSFDRSESGTPGCERLLVVHASPMTTTPFNWLNSIFQSFFWSQSTVFVCLFVFTRHYILLGMYLKRLQNNWRHSTLTCREGAPILWFALGPQIAKSATECGVALYRSLNYALLYSHFLVFIPFELLYCPLTSFQPNHNYSVKINTQQQMKH